MPKLAENIEHDSPTQRNGYRYVFTTKHHGGPGSSGESQWLVDLDLADEFAIFDSADQHEIKDSIGSLHGVRRLESGELADIGTWDQQIAKFPAARLGEAWHGYPLYPIGRAGPEHFKGRGASLNGLCSRDWNRSA